jgi:hypothetical protein
MAQIGGYGWAPMPVGHCAEASRAAVADLMRLYRAMYMLGNYTEAESVARKILALDPQSIIGKAALDLACQHTESNLAQADCGLLTGGALGATSGALIGGAVGHADTGALIGTAIGAVMDGMPCCNEACAESGCCAKSCCDAATDCASKEKCECGKGTSCCCKDKCKCGGSECSCRSACKCCQDNSCNCACCKSGCKCKTAAKQACGCCGCVRARVTILCPPGMAGLPMPACMPPCPACLPGPVCCPAPCVAGPCPMLPPPCPNVWGSPGAGPMPPAGMGCMLPMPSAGPRMPYATPARNPMPASDVHLTSVRRVKTQGAAPVSITAAGGRVHVTTEHADAAGDRVIALDARDRIVLQGNVNVHLHGEHEPCTIQAERIAIGLRDGSYEINPPASPRGATTKVRTGATDDAGECDKPASSPEDELKFMLQQLHWD